VPQQQCAHSLIFHLWTSISTIRQVKIILFSRACHTHEHLIIDPCGSLTDDFIFLEKSNIHMRQFTFRNDTDQTIDQVNPTTITSIINANDTVGKLVAVRVKLNIEHSYTSDLRITLSSPSNNTVALSSNIGGSGDNFVDTVFDDNADQDIVNSSPPFTGQFRPFEALSKFIDENPAGQWTLSIEDQAFQDGGILDDWELLLITDAEEQVMPLIFNNMTTQQISAGAPNSIRSTIVIDQHPNQTVEELVLTIDVDHSYTNDLKISLAHDSGTSIDLVSFVGGSGDNFRQTVFDDKAVADIRSGSPPFTGSFQLLMVFPLTVCGH